MKIIILEANAEELRANKRAADVISDALVGFLDSIVRVNDNSSTIIESEEK